LSNLDAWTKIWLGTSCMVDVKWSSIWVISKTF
jgi:hypothetical protein